MTAKIFERCLIWVVCKKAEELEQALNDSQLAKGVFDVGHPVNAWRSTRNSTRALTLQEAYRLAGKIDLPFENLCWDVCNELRNGWTLKQDVSLKKPAPGRPSKNMSGKKEAVPKERYPTDGSISTSNSEHGIDINM
jgi:hypothetical protein